MPTGLTATDPIWTFDIGLLEAQVATYAKANSITTQAAWDTFINGISTTAQAVAICKGLLRSVRCSNP
jgi:hypothetical protein